MSKQVVWDKSYELGFPEIDNQHKKLICIANALYDIATVGGPNLKRDMELVLKSLTEYTVYHFESEEKFQKQYGYTGYNMHKLAHNQFVQEVQHQISKLNTESQDEALRFYDYIANWVLMHIAKADKLWAVYVKNQIEQ